MKNEFDWKFFSVIEWKSEKCGIRIKNISVANTGLWRLTSSAENNKRRTTGVTFVNVRGRHVLRASGSHWPEIISVFPSFHLTKNNQN